MLKALPSTIRSLDRSSLLARQVFVDGPDMRARSALAIKRRCNSQETFDAVGVDALTHWASAGVNARRASKCGRLVVVVTRGNQNSENVVRLARVNN